MALHRISTLALVILPITSALACGDGDGDDAAPDARQALAEFEACGGDPSGEWDIHAYYVDDIGAASVVDEALREDSACTGAIEDARARVLGTSSFADGKWEMLATNREAQVDVRVDDECLAAVLADRPEDRAEAEALSPNIESCALLQTSFDGENIEGTPECSFVKSACECSVSIIGEGRPSSTSEYTVSGTQLIVNGAPWDFCQRDDRLELRQGGPDSSTELFVFTKR
jgi:hypothetical protein